MALKGFDPSILEKLFDDAPQDNRHTGIFKRFSLEQIKDSVARDLEMLLNTRRSLDEETLTPFPHCQRSLATYGLSDFSGRSLASTDDRNHIVKSIELSIARHEPRLKNVTVELDASQRASGALRFSIRADLVIHPSKEPVNFDAMLQPGTLQYAVSPQKRPTAMR